MYRWMWEESFLIDSILHVVCAVAHYHLYQVIVSVLLLVKVDGWSDVTIVSAISSNEDVFVLLFWVKNRGWLNQDLGQIEIIWPYSTPYYSISNPSFRFYYIRHHRATSLCEFWAVPTSQIEHHKLYKQSVFRQYVFWYDFYKNSACWIASDKNHIWMDARRYGHGYERPYYVWMSFFLWLAITVTN